jgi:hypothetical protein
MPKTTSRRPARSGSVSMPGRPKSTNSELELPSDLPRLRRQAEKGAPVVPSHLALNDEERGQIQDHLDLVGVDKCRFEHTHEDQGAN